MLILYIAAGFLGGGIVGLGYVFADLKKIKRDNAKSYLAMPEVENVDSVDIFEPADIEQNQPTEQVEVQQPQKQQKVKQPREVKVKQASTRQPLISRTAKAKVAATTVATEVYSHSPEFYQIKATDMLNYKNIVDAQFATAWETCLVGHNCGALNESEVEKLNEILNRRPETMQDPFANQEAEVKQQPVKQAEQPVQQQDEAVASPSKVLQPNSVWQAQPLDEYPSEQPQAEVEQPVAEQWQMQPVEDAVVEEGAPQESPWQTQTVEDTVVEQSDEVATQAEQSEPQIVEDVAQSDNADDAKKKVKASTKRKTNNKQ